MVINYVLFAEYREITKLTSHWGAFEALRTAKIQSWATEGKAVAKSKNARIAIVRWLGSGFMNF